MVRRAAGLLLALALSGCVGFWRGPRCRDRPLPHAEREAVKAAVEAAAAPAPPHADYAALLPFRSYFRLDRVGPLAHHFAAYFACVERNVEIYAVTRDPRTGAALVELERGMWGPVTIPSARDVTPPPAAARALGEAVRRRVDREHRHERRLMLSYLGEYRLVFFSELVPGGMPGDPTQRGVVRMSAELHASAGLDRLVNERIPFEGGVTLLCWEGWGTCGRVPRWFDLEPDERDGASLTGTLLRSSERSPPLERERRRLLAAALAAAREAEGGAPPRPLGSLAAQRAPLLPPDLEQRLHYGFTLYARPADGRHDRQEQADVGVWLSLREAAFGVARGHGAARIAGLGVTLAAELAADEPLGADAAGEREVPMTLRLRLGDERGVVRSVAVPLHQRLLVGNGQAGVLRFGPPTGKDPPANPIPDEQRHQALPGHGAFRAIDAYFFSGT
ncbi:MAG: hypothetical protein JW751_08245 [Polyangiaceae bacterium]|nr:hypothetical protein [Polyangiaceae bacterium]